MASRVVRILMERDGLTEEEALAESEECREEMLLGNDYAMEDCLGIENDYIDEVLF